MRVATEEGLPMIDFAPVTCIRSLLKSRKGNAANRSVGEEVDRTRRIMNNFFKYKQQSPHISRFFPVWLTFLSEHLLLITLLIFFVIAHINASKLIHPPCCSDVVLSVLKDTHNLEFKLALSRYYWKNGRTREATREIEIVKDMMQARIPPAAPKGEKVLGTVSDSLDETIRLMNPIQAPRINMTESFWKKIVEEKPDYRDGYIILSLLSYEKKLYDEAVNYKNKALSLDPNYPLPAELSSLKSQ